MSFTPGIPTTGQSLGNSRPQVLGNFTTINSTISENHVPMNNTGAGKHNLSEYVVQSQSPATAMGEVAVYSRTVSNPELFLQKQGQLAAASDIQMSRLDKGVLASLNGYTFLPGGLIMQWGRDAFVGAATTKTTTFPIAFAANSFNINVTLVGFDNAGNAQSNTLVDFVAIRAAGGGTNQAFWWVAIGN